MYCDGVPGKLPFPIYICFIEWLSFGDAARYVSAYSSGCDTLPRVAGLKRLGAYMDFLADDGRTLLQSDKCGSIKEISDPEYDTRSRQRQDPELEGLRVDFNKVERTNVSGRQDFRSERNMRRSARPNVSEKMQLTIDHEPSVPVTSCSSAPF